MLSNQIKSNCLFDILNCYQKELKPLYEASEIEAIFYVVCDSFQINSRSSQLNKLYANQSQLISFYNILNQLKKQIPVQYILQEVTFYNLNLYVTPDVLIPRPETEELVDIIIKKHCHQSKQIQVLDIGSGSGCIALTLKKNILLSHATGIDVSEKALLVAKINKEKLKLDVTFLQQNIFEVFNINTKFDIIVSNPPYVLEIEKKDMTPQVLNHEPHLALFVSNLSPIVYYTTIIVLCNTYLNSNGYLYFELNPKTANLVKQEVEQSNLFKVINLIADMSGKLRFLEAQKK